MSATVTEMPVAQAVEAPTAAPRTRTAATPTVFRAAEKTAEFLDRLRAHYRETRRISVEIPCDVRIIAKDGAAFDSGTAVVRNVSPSGALITNFKLSRDCFPATGFKLMLVLRGDGYDGIGIEATPVRLVSEVAGLGVRFDEIFVAV